jgi:hypothetical protein
MAMNAMIIAPHTHTLPASNNLFTPSLEAGTRDSPFHVNPLLQGDVVTFSSTKVQSPFESHILK